VHRREATASGERTVIAVELLKHRDDNSVVRGRDYGRNRMDIPKPLVLTAFFIKKKATS
jgi:hypothetical protein